MGEVKQLAIGIVPMPAVARILSRYDRNKVEAFIEIAIGLLDTFDGPDDPDAPDFSPRFDGQPGDLADHEPGGDEEAGAFANGPLRAPQRRAGMSLVKACGSEDDELGGDEADGNGTEDEDCAWFRRFAGSVGCPIADPGGCQYD
jgi:hypothetical protein